MRTTALIAAAALAFGTAAFAQQQDTTKNRGEQSARVDQQDHGTAGEKIRGAVHKLGEKTRNALHRAGDKTRQVAGRDHAADTRAMGGPGTAASREAMEARQDRMDEAYARWQEQQHKQEASR